MALKTDGIMCSVQNNHQIRLNAMRVAQEWIIWIIYFLYAVLVFAGIGWNRADFSHQSLLGISVY